MIKALLIKTLCVSVNQNVRLDKEKTAKEELCDYVMGVLDRVLLSAYIWSLYHQNVEQPKTVD